MVLYKQIDEQLSVIPSAVVTQINFYVSVGLLQYIKQKNHTSVL
jgi:hypothetical protein